MLPIFQNSILKIIIPIIVVLLLVEIKKELQTMPKLKIAKHLKLRILIIKHLKNNYLYLNVGKLEKITNNVIYVVYY